VERFDRVAERTQSTVVASLRASGKQQLLTALPANRLLKTLQRASVVLRNSANVDLRRI